MDSLISAAGRALSRGDMLNALKLVALRDDPPALALRGIAMAQLGEHALARQLLKRAARGFGNRHAQAHARCVVAEAEVALAMRDLRATPRPLAAASATLERAGDHANAVHAQLIVVRRLLLLGRLAEAADALAALDARRLPSSLLAVAELASAELALRSLRSAWARDALIRAHEAAQRAAVPALLAEVEDARAALTRPAARRRVADRQQLLHIDQVQALLDSGALVVDACRRGLRAGSRWQPLARRPVLFALARALAEAWPGNADRHQLIASAFGVRRPDETHRARLRVEIGRLRALLKPMASIAATADGFVLSHHSRHEVVVLLPPIEGQQASLLALLADGAAWSTSALSLALNASQRSVQRALVELAAAGKVRSTGRARAQRWLAPPLSGFTTILLLPATLPP